MGGIDGRHPAAAFGRSACDLLALSNANYRPVAACRHSQDPTVKLQDADVRRTTKLGRLARGGFPGTGRPTLRQRDRGPEVGTRSGSSAIDRSARSARALASFASYADPLLSHTEIVSSSPERHSDLGKAETS